MGMEITDLLSDHLRRYPKMEARDIYKLLFQAALGAGHAVTDAAAAQAWLARELAAMGPGPDDPLLDPISPDGRMVRVHLRPYVQAGQDPQVLLQAFLQTANEWRGATEVLGEYGQAAARSSPSPMGEAIQAFFATMKAQGFPAAHHSAAYQTLYRPAYRVVAREFLA
ncbi:MAG: hypothetical protein JXB85_16905 [Anaerolineales bacterium]|nr:hypothetical protein [Anaerolineales bacterium]